MLEKAQRIVQSPRQEDNIRIEKDEHGLPMAYVLRQDGYYGKLTKTLINMCVPDTTEHATARDAEEGEHHTLYTQV